MPPLAIASLVASVMMWRGGRLTTCLRVMMVEGLRKARRLGVF